MITFNPFILNVPFNPFIPQVTFKILILQVTFSPFFPQVTFNPFILQVQEIQPALEECQLEAMRKRWFVEDHPAQPHLWEEDETVARWLEGQLDPQERSVSQVPTHSVSVVNFSVNVP